MEYNLVDILLLCLAGAVGGFMSGLLGVGGGIIFIPILDYAFTQYGFPKDEIVKFILANSLFIIVFTGMMGSYKQYKANNFFPRYILYTALPAIATALLCTWLIAQGTWYKKSIFNIVFIGMLAPLIIRMLYTRKHVPDATAADPAPYKFGLVGLVTGCFTAFSGLGGGMIMVPSFTDVLKVNIKKATSVSVGAVPLIALSLSASYFFATPLHAVSVPHLGYIVYTVAVPMAAGTLFTVGYGVKLAHRLPSSVIKTIFALFALAVISKIIIENYA